MNIFQQTRQAPPWPTRVPRATSEILRGSGWWIAADTVASFFALSRGLALPGPNAEWETAALRLPVLGRKVRVANSVRFAGTLAILTAAGVPLLRALEAAQAILANVVLAETAIKTIAVLREDGTRAREVQRKRFRL